MKLLRWNSVMARYVKAVVLTWLLGSSYSFPQPPQSSTASIFKLKENLVFLGGSCNPTTWRRNIAIPKLDQLHIPYYNPQVDDWRPELVDIEAKAKDSARVLLFVLDDQTRNIVSMIEVAQLSATRPDSLKVVASSYRKGLVVANEVLTEGDFHELTNGLKVLKKLLAERNIRVFSNIEDAIDDLSKIVKSPVQSRVSLLTNSLLNNINDYSRDMYIGTEFSDLTPSEEQLIKWHSDLTYYRPSSTHYTADSLPNELAEMRKSRVVVLSVPKNQRTLSVMILAAHLVGLRANLVLSIQNLVSVPGETLTKAAIKDYNRGRTYLQDMAVKAGVPVYSNPADAVKKALEMVKNLRG